MDSLKQRYTVKRLGRLKNPLLQRHGAIPESYRFRYQCAQETIRSLKAPRWEQILELHLMFLD